MPDDLCDLFCRLVTTPSPTGAESAVAGLVSDYLAGLGLSVSHDSAQEVCPAQCGNLLAFLPASAPDRPVMMLNAHLDTVVHDCPIEPQVEGERIRSASGTILGADDKAGVALILLALRRLVEQRLPHGDLWVVFTVAEETGLWGARHLDYARLAPWPQMGYVLDGGRQAGKLTTAAPSSCSLDARITGRAAHAGVCPEQGISALLVAARALAGMRLGRIDEETTANVGQLQAGSARNIVPASCTLTGEARSHSEQKLADQIRQMQERLEEAAGQAGAELEVQVERLYSAFALADDSPVVERAVQAAGWLGLEPVTERGGGGSDANWFNERGLPSVIMATGAANVHTPQETLHLPTAHQCLEWLVEILTA